MTASLSAVAPAAPLLGPAGVFLWGVQNTCLMRVPLLDRSRQALGEGDFAFPRDLLLTLVLRLNWAQREATGRDLFPRLPTDAETLKVPDLEGDVVQRPPLRAGNRTRSLGKHQRYARKLHGRDGIPVPGLRTRGRTRFAFLPETWSRRDAAIQGLGTQSEAVQRYSTSVHRSCHRPIHRFLPHEWIRLSPAVLIHRDVRHDETRSSF
jgi:hypothetical protein